MSGETGRDEESIIHAAYAERVRELFLVMAEGLATGEDELRLKERFRRALHSARRARAAALETSADEKESSPAA